MNDENESLTTPSSATGPSMKSKEKLAGPRPVRCSAVLGDVFAALQESLDLIDTREAFEKVEYAIEGITATRLAVSILENDYLTREVNASELRAMLEDFRTCKKSIPLRTATRERILPCETSQSVLNPPSDEGGKSPARPLQHPTPSYSREVSVPGVRGQAATS